MRLRKLHEEEIQAIITLLQRADNIGTGYWSDEQAKECILKAETDMPTMRAKDVDIAWTLEVINGARKHRYAADEPIPKNRIPTIKELPTDDIFEILAQKIHDDETGDLLDELERRSSLSF